MAKQTNITDGYVRIDLRRPGDYGACIIGGTRRTEQEIKDDLNRLEEAAKRKLSKFDDERGAVSVVYETEEVCEHCGYPWTEESTTYNGGCCARDELENPEDQAW